MAMGRKRIHDKHLPLRMSCHHGGRRDTYYYRDPGGPKEPLGHDLASALLRYAELVGERDGSLMRDVIDAYTVEVLPTLRPSTAKDYAHILARLRAGLGHMTVPGVTPRAIYKYRSLWPGPRGNRHVAVLSAVMGLAVRRGLIDRNPCRQVKRLTEHARRRYVTDAEFLAVFEKAPKPLRLAMDLAVVTGLRQADLLRLPLSAATEAGISVGTAKTGRALTIAWTPDLRAVVDAARAYKPGKVRATTLLVNSRGERWTGNGFRTAWQRLQRASLEDGTLAERFWFHDLRSRAAGNAPDGSRLLGHTSDRVTRRHYERGPQRVLPASRICPKPKNMPKSGDGENG